eukprot:5192900-Pleurochrysis_carterae.AAC.2
MLLHATFASTFDDRRAVTLDFSPYLLRELSTTGCAIHLDTPRTVLRKCWSLRSVRVATSWPIYPPSYSLCCMLNCPGDIFIRRHCNARCIAPSETAWNRRCTASCMEMATAWRAPGSTLFNITKVDARLGDGGGDVEG